MSRASWGSVARELDRVLRLGVVAGLTEVQLIDRFVRDGDDVAFEAIVSRFGPMVLAVCRDTLDDPHEIDDAFQATFLVLVRKVRGLRRKDQLGSWLYGVARRVALRARATSARRRQKTRSWEDSLETPASVGSESLGDELRPLIRDEVDRLPSRYREAVILCYFEGQTHEQAAERLGWPLGTVKGRLARARDCLRDRLIRRGITAMTSTAVGASLSQSAKAALPAALRSSTVSAAMSYGIQGGVLTTVGSALISSTSVQLAQGVLRTMSLGKLKVAILSGVTATAVALPGVFSAGGDGALSAKASATPPQQSSSPVDALKRAKTKASSPTSTNPVASASAGGIASGPSSGGVSAGAASPVAGKRPANSSSSVSGGSAVSGGMGPGPAPEQAQKDRRLNFAKVASDLYRSAREAYLESKLPPSDLLTWSCQLLDADLSVADDRNGRIRAYEGHLKRMEEVRDVESKLFGAGRSSSFRDAAAKFLAMEAGFWVTEARESPDGRAASRTSAARSTGGAPASMPENPTMGMMMGAMGGGREPMGGSGMMGGREPMGGGGMMAGMGPMKAPPGSGGGAAAGQYRGQPSRGQNMPGGMAAAPADPFGGSGGGVMAGPTLETRPKRSVARDRDPKSQTILKRLNEPVSLNFANETPLEDVVKFVKTLLNPDLDGPNAKRSAIGKISIYVDPIGLAEAEKTMTSTVQIDVDDVALRTGLRLLLDQLDLGFYVEEGLIIITYKKNVPACYDDQGLDQGVERDAVEPRLERIPDPAGRK